jgi:hypothetical protein
MKTEKYNNNNKKKKKKKKEKRKKKYWSCIMSSFFLAFCFLSFFAIYYSSKFCIKRIVLSDHVCANLLLASWFRYSRWLWKIVLREIAKIKTPGCVVFATASHFALLRPSRSRASTSTSIPINSIHIMFPGSRVNAVKTKSPVVLVAIEWPWSSSSVGTKTKNPVSK